MNINRLKPKLDGLSEEMFNAIIQVVLYGDRDEYTLTMLESVIKKATGKTILELRSMV